MRPVFRATPELSGIRTMHTGLQRPPARLPAPGQFHPQQRIGFPFRIPLATPGLAESHPALKADGLPVLAVHPEPRQAQYPGRILQQLTAHAPSPRFVADEQHLDLRGRYA